MSKNLTARLFAAAGLTGLVASTAAAAPEPGAKPTEATIDADALEGATAEELTATVKDAFEAGVANGKITGAKEANDRTAAVFASDEAKANPGLAAFMLCNSTADAGEIIKQLGAQGAATAPAAAAPAAAPAATEEKPAAPAAAQPTIEGMVTDTPSPARATPTDANDEGATDLKSAFGSVDFTGKSAIVEDGLRRAGA